MLAKDRSEFVVPAIVFRLWMKPVPGGSLTTGAVSSTLKSTSLTFWTKVEARLPMMAPAESRARSRARVWAWNTWSPGGTQSAPVNKVDQVAVPVVTGCQQPGVAQAVSSTVVEENLVPLKLTAPV